MARLGDRTRLVIHDQAGTIALFCATALFGIGLVIGVLVISSPAFTGFVVEDAPSPSATVWWSLGALGMSVLGAAAILRAYVAGPARVRIGATAIGILIGIPCGGLAAICVAVLTL